MPPHDHDRQVAIYGACPACVKAQTAEALGRANPTADDEGNVVTVCRLCTKPVKVNDPRVYRRVSGWSLYRGATGGTHALRLRQEHHEYAHGDCIDAAKAGRLNQPPLALDDPGF